MYRRKRSKKEEGLSETLGGADKTCGGTHNSSCANYSTARQGLKSLAQAQFDKIGIGRENAYALSNRDNNDCTVRETRQLIQMARLDGIPIVNIGNGHGYYIARLDRPDEVDELRQMIAQLSHRANEMLDVAQALSEKIGDRYMHW